MKSEAERWLEHKTFYCERFRLRVRPDLCTSWQAGVISPGQNPYCSSGKCAQGAKVAKNAGVMVKTQRLIDAGRRHLSVYEVKRLGAYFNRLGRTRKDLASIMGVTQMTVTRWLARKAQLDLATLRLLYKVLAVKR